MNEDVQKTSRINYYCVLLLIIHILKTITLHQKKFSDDWITAEPRDYYLQAYVLHSLHLLQLINIGVRQLAQ